MQPGRQLRHLFAIILIFQHPLDPLDLWETYKDSLCDDLQRTLIRMNYPNPTEEQVYDYGLYLLNEILIKSGKSLSDFNLPLSVLPWAAVANNAMLQQELDYDFEILNQQVTDNTNQFNNEQSQAFTNIASVSPWLCHSCFMRTFAITPF